MATMVKKTLERLESLGFSEPEARTYIALMQFQPATGYEIAKLSGLAKANTYNALATLERKGAVQPVSGRPVRYAPTSPKRFFSGHATSVVNTCDRVVSDLHNMAAPPSGDFVELTTGHAGTHDAIASTIRSTSQFLYLKSKDELAKPFFADLADAAERGVQVFIVASGKNWEDMENRPNVVIVPHEGTGSVPSATHEVLLTMTVDLQQALVATLGQTRRAYHAQDRTLVYVIQTMILHEIYLSRIINTIGLEILVAHEVDPDTLRAKWRPERHGVDGHDGS